MGKEKRKRKKKKKGSVAMKGKEHFNSIQLPL